MDASVSLNNVTISNNTASFQVGEVAASRYGNVTLKNSILANNTAGTSPDCKDTLISQGYNIIENTESCTVTPTSGDQIHVDPQLGPLNPALGLQPLLVTSPAIDAGNPAAPGSGGTACLAVDQRETERPLDGPIRT